MKPSTFVLCRRAEINLAVPAPLKQMKYLGYDHL
jgi:hypothetical protein